jgi:hypothetical protein
LNFAVWVPIVVAIIAPLGAYLLAARKMSGRVATSDANALWKEAGAIRDDYRGQLKTADDRIQNLEVRIGALEDMNNTLAADNRSLRIEISALQARPSVEGR